jgi:hypothetical protein
VTRSLACRAAASPPWFRSWPDACAGANKVGIIAIDPRALFGRLDHGRPHPDDDLAGDEGLHPQRPPAARGGMGDLDSVDISTSRAWLHPDQTVGVGREVGSKRPHTTLGGLRSRLGDEIQAIGAGSSRSPTSTWSARATARRAQASATSSRSDAGDPLDASASGGRRWSPPAIKGRLEELVSALEAQGVLEASGGRAGPARSEFA